MTVCFVQRRVCLAQGFLGRWASFLKMPSTVAPLVLLIPEVAMIHTNISVVVVVVVVFQPAEIAVDLDLLHGIA